VRNDGRVVRDRGEVVNEARRAVLYEGEGINLAGGRVRESASVTSFDGGLASSAGGPVSSAGEARKLVGG